MTYRIQRVVESDAVVFLLSGELDAAHARKLRELMAGEAPGRVQLDLRDVTLVDRSGIEFLAGVHAMGVVLVNCADYVSRLVNAEESR